MNSEPAKMTPYKYARARNLQPQQVYYYVRSNKLATETCACGDAVLDVADADAFFEEKNRNE